MPYKNAEKRKENWRKTNKTYYDKNKSARLFANKSRRKDVIDRITEYKKSKVCSLCGESYFRCLQFHHLDSANKESEISTAARKGWSWERVLIEINKCSVLCANCHIKTHFPV